MTTPMQRRVADAREVTRRKLIAKARRRIRELEKRRKAAATEAWFRAFTSGDGVLAQMFPGLAAGPSFAALGLSTNATVNEVKKAYRKLAHQLHPDHGGTGEDFVKLQEHYKRALKAAKSAQAD